MTSAFNFLFPDTLPRVSKAKTPASPSPSFKSPVTPPVFVPKESNAPLPSLYSSQPSYVAPSCKSPVPTYQKQSSYSYQPQESTTPTPKVDLGDFDNFNTAPRGWQKSQSFYRPITFNKQTYSDF